jgi:cell pole-organizing protein PopZ
MSAQAKPNEPSMEEILASIRRIISDDEGKTAEASPAAEPAAAAAAVAVDAPSNDDDVLDLAVEATRVETPAVAEAPPAGPGGPVENDIDFLETPAPAIAPVNAPAAVPVMAAPAPQPVAAPEPTFAQAPALDMAGLLSEQSSAAVNAAFGQLAHTVLSQNARTLEDLVKDMLKPMLKSWLDDNLPTMVERLVRAEIERVARGGRG